MHVRYLIVYQYIILHQHYENISGKCILGTSKNSLHQHGTLRSNQCLDGALR